ncbi:MAG TPA: DUF3267 domain-containing protein [Anaerolineales bacterium]|nr:DUF3267 domain-containing protein [Anaerolineales bacterium]
MISATRTLPDGYRQTDEINLAKNKGLSILLNLGAVLIFIACLMLLGWLLGWARPDLVSGTFTFTSGLLQVAGLFAAVILMLLAHEAIHGLFFWIFTHSKPVFALRPLYAYAAAPDWYIPARQYLIVALAPLVLIDLIGLLAILAMPAGWVLISAFLAALNTGGSVGDVYIVARLLRLSAGSLAKDAGDSVSFFEATSGTSTSV